MWNRKKTTILEDSRLDRLRESYKELLERIERLEFQLKSPAKYSVGDKPKKGFVITEVNLKANYGISFSGTQYLIGFYWDYTCIDINTGKQVSI